MIFLSMYVFVCRVVQYLILLELDMSPMVTVMHPVLLLSQRLYTACGAWSSTIFLSIRYVVKQQLEPVILANFI